MIFAKEKRKKNSNVRINPTNIIRTWEKAVWELEMMDENEQKWEATLNMCRPIYVGTMFDFTSHWNWLRLLARRINKHFFLVRI